MGSVITIPIILEVNYFFALRDVGSTYQWYSGVRGFLS
jgi:hypothetical protein